MRLEKFKDNDSVVLCLDFKSLLTCLELAAKLHAWVYVIQSKEVQDPYVLGRTLGVVLNSGQFVTNPEISRTEYDDIYMNFSSQIEQHKREAMSALNRSGLVNNISLEFINGRNVLLTDDIFRSAMNIAIVQTILKPLSPLHIEGVAGNILGDVYTKLYLETQGTTYMDVIPTNFFDDDHYFEQLDGYSDEQKYELAKNISIYWA